MTADSMYVLHCVACDDIQYVTARGPTAAANVRPRETTATRSPWRDLGGS